MLKKIFKFILVVIILLAVGLAAYWYFDRQQGGSGIPLVGENKISVGDFFPFGNGGPSGTTTPTGNTNTGTTTPSETPVAAPRLWQISEKPQSGVVTFLASSTNPLRVDASRVPFVRFVDKATGNIFESELAFVGLNRITNTTIPKVYEALWQPKADAVFMRYLDENNETIKTTYGKLGPVLTGTDQNIRELRASFMPTNISSFAVNPTTGAIAYIEKGTASAQVSVAKADTSGNRVIFESPIKDFTILWMGDTTLGLLSKPSTETTGQFYSLKTDTGTLSRVLGNRSGLVVLPNPSGTKVFYSAAQSSTFATALFDTKTGAETAVPFRTIPDKCVWSPKTAFIYCATPKSIPSEKYPDAWYQGKVSFNDTVWRMDTVTGATEFLIDPAVTTEKEFDVVNLTLDPTETYLIFTNKKDAQLWGLRIQKGS